MAIRGGLPLPPLSLSPSVKSLKFSALTSLSFSPSIIRFARLSLLNSSKASNAINTKKIHNSSDLGEQSELLHRSVSQHRPPLLMLPNEERSESRDEGWTTLNRQWGSYEDVIYHKGKFYCIIDSGNLVACDFSSNGLPKLTKISKSDGKRISESDGKRSGRRYLVESSGELLNVCRYYEMHPMYVRYLILGSSKCLDGDFDPRNLGWTMRTSYFEVSKLDQNTGKWIELESLGDQVLFLGLNSSLSLSALDFPQLKRNCIYFTDDSDVNNEGIDNGVYDLENESIKPCYPNSPSWITKLIWLHPNLCGVPNC
ncbi:F-box protein SKIP23-like isoform X6 [Tasmannia lanceolata]|uniref:F-box protein SKIP23-like isoform X6 n=1 Tax=Tasmannia lanceolata TaxID=3420 RepID=UPI0040645CB1